MIELKLISFGRKFAPAPDAHFVLDARGLNNPYWVKSLRGFSGLEQPITEFFAQDPHCQQQLELFFGLTKHNLHLFQTKGKSELIIAIGCTGGRHRSVYLCNQLYLRFQELDQNCQCQHRDLHHDSHESY